ncbi:YihY/virulence factor BrkB family protein [soil metagenome]
MRTLLTPVIVLAAVARSRRSAGSPAVNPYPSKDEQEPSAEQGGPGIDAAEPTQIPAQGWKEVLRRTKQQVKDDNVPLLSAGVAFYVFIALFPALIAAVTVYGLVADPQQVEEQISGLTDALPSESAELITGQLRDIASGSSSALGWGLVASLGGALFAASGGMQNLVKAVNIAYDEEETRGFVRLRALALLMTVGLVVFLAVAIGLVAVVPVLLEVAGLGGAAGIAVQVARWLGLVAFVMLALAVLYRYAPDRDAPRFTWVGLGSIVATLLWIIGSAGFSLYVSTFGSYGETYGALAGVVVLLLWLFLTSFIVLVGAEINSEAEQQTGRDTTKGPERPIGERDAVKADTLPSRV